MTSDVTYDVTSGAQQSDARMTAAAGMSRARNEDYETRRIVLQKSAAFLLL